MNAANPSLQPALDALAPPGLLIAHRLIAAGDEHALLDVETASIASPAVAVRRASGAARIVARALLERLGYPGTPVPRGAGGAPVWPEGVTGSLAHDDRIAVAAVGLKRDHGSVGIDIEPAVPLPPDMIALVAMAAELERIAGDPLLGRLLFAAKEAVYKAVYPLDGAFLEFHDITIDLAGKKAVTKTGRMLALRWCIAPHIVVLALQA